MSQSVPDPELTAYDEVAYPGHAYAQTHPTRLAAIAQLLGVKPAPSEACRVLELACGDGANLIPMAVALPGSQFVGIDLASRAVAAGCETIAELGLRNIELKARDMSALGGTLGQFDYVIAHGVYSWVPDNVRDGLIAAIKQHLAPNGVAYVSFSAYPGAYFRELARELMSFHAGALPPTARLQHGIDFLRYVREVHGPNTAYAAALDQEIRRVSKADPGYVFHDDFAEHNTPMYFAAFAEHLAEHELAYLADASFDFFFDRRLSMPVRERIAEYSGGDVIAEQQYLDFVRGTPFRQVLVCHTHTAIDRTPNPTLLLPLNASAWLRCSEQQPDFLTAAKLLFTSQDGVEAETDEPFAKALLFELASAWPDHRKVEDLFSRAAARVDGPTHTADAAQHTHRLRVLQRTLFSGAATRLISLWAGDIARSATCGERPLASPLARLQASRGELVTSLNHVAVRLTDLRARRLLQLMDGTRTRQQLLTALHEQLSLAADEPQVDVTLEALETTLAGLTARSFVLA